MAAHVAQELSLGLFCQPDCLVARDHAVEPLLIALEGCSRLRRLRLQSSKLSYQLRSLPPGLAASPTLRCLQLAKCELHAIPALPPNLRSLDLEMRGAS